MINKNLIFDEEPNFDGKVNKEAETAPSVIPQTRSRAKTAKPAVIEEFKSEAILDEPIDFNKEKVDTMKDSDKEKAKKAKSKEKDKAKKKEKAKKEKQKAKDKEKKKKAKKKDKEKKAKKKSKSKKKK